MRFRRGHYTHRNIHSYPDILIKDYDHQKGKWHELFGNNNPIHLEIGTGKGQFITTLAEQNPNVNYIAMEKIDIILTFCADKIFEKNLENIKIINGDANHLDTMFTKGELERIYLNFSDPWYKKRYAKRRLTHKNFLEKYINILGPRGEIHFKTDNRDLFEFSLNEMLEFGLKLRNISLNLHKDAEVSKCIVTTEYEDKFKSNGMEIYRLEAYL